MGEPLLTAVQVAELLSVPKTRVWSMSRRGEIHRADRTARGALSAGRHRRLDRATDHLGTARYAFLTRNHCRERGGGG